MYLQHDEEVFVGSLDRLELGEAYPPGAVIILPGNTPHFHWAKSSEYVSHITAVGPLGLEYIDSKDDPRNNNSQQGAARLDDSHTPISLKRFDSYRIELEMNGQHKNEQHSGVRDQEIRAALDQHWAASDADNLETEHRIYHEDAVLDYPQSGERTRGRRSTQNQRTKAGTKRTSASV